MKTLIQEAFQLLGIRQFMLSIHDQSFPSLENEETGRGSPYSKGAEKFLEFAAGLGFTVVQFGPQGMTSLSDPSPYMGTVFGKNPLSLSPARIMEFHDGALFSEKDWGRIMENLSPPSRNWTDYSLAWIVCNRIMDSLAFRFQSVRLFGRDLENKYENWVRGEMDRPLSWLERYGVFEALAREKGTNDWTQWEDIDRRLYFPLPGEENFCRARIDSILNENSVFLNRRNLAQFLLYYQHKDFLTRVHALGLKIFGDLQVGFSHQDLWAWNGIFLPGYLLGAPPSRTNPEGQPWGYPVINPRLYNNSTRETKAGTEDPGLVFFRFRIDAMLEQFDGIRIDHPQGIVCPWVYRSDIADPFKAVQNGARLFSSPNLSDHPNLGDFSIARADQLSKDPKYPRHGDQWETSLDPIQIDQYAVLLDTILKRAERHEGKREYILCEVLSTWPYPLRVAMEARGLGRFCVTQKANPNDPMDIYRMESTSPGDWVMPGNHDTPPLKMIIRERWGTDWVRARGQMLAAELIPDVNERMQYQEKIVSDPREFCRAIFAELFLGPARNVSVFFTDLLGLEEIYNHPGVINERNWSLRVPPDYKLRYAQGRRDGDVFDIPRSLALALRAKRKHLGTKAEELAKGLEEKG